MSQSTKPETIVQEVQAAVPDLRGALANVMKVAAEALNHQLSLEGGGSALPLPTEPLDKALEDFYSQCDRLGNVFNVGCDCLAMSELSTHFSPVPIRAPNSDGTEGSQSYSDFIVSLTKQVNTMEQLVGTLEKFSSQMSCSANPEDGSA